MLSPFRAQLSTLWTSVVLLAVAYLALPPVHRAIAAKSEGDEGFLTSILATHLLVISPALTLVVSAAAGYRYGFVWALIPLTALAWLPAVFFTYNSSALAYTPLFAVIAALGLLVGRGLRRVFRRSSQPR
ncbi:MAG: hypothetical protein IPL36_14055 [Nigerium sp.]|nr:hypothetical protein [Nigerium sp.]